MNGLFRIKRLIAEGTADEHLAARRRYRRPLVDRFMTLLRKCRLNSHKYGAAVMKAVNYIFDDEVAFRHIAMVCRRTSPSCTHCWRTAN